MADWPFTREELEQLAHDLFANDDDDSPLADVVPLQRAKEDDPCPK